VPRTRIDSRRAKLHRSYTVEETTRLFGVSRTTVRAWVGAGLEVIDQAKPALIRGVALRTFLDSRRKAARRPCPPGTLYCFKCRTPRAPALGMADFLPRETGAGNIHALCEACGTAMHRRAKEADLGAILPSLAVRIVRAEGHIVERTPPSLNCTSGRPLRP
jgi:hypothetical protein